MIATQPTASLIIILPRGARTVTLPVWGDAEITLP